MLTLCDTEVVVRVLVLEHAVLRRSGADGEHRGWTFGTLGPPDLRDILGHGTYVSNEQEGYSTANPGRALAENGGVL